LGLKEKRKEELKKLPKHPYHIVTRSPWPILVGLTALPITLSAVMYMHSYNKGGFLLIVSLLTLTVLLIAWWRDVIREATFMGLHTLAVQRSHRLGFILFIFSEVMFFFGFFWAYFHLAIDPSIHIGSVWPPDGIIALKPQGVPLLNTYILLLSGATITYTHYSLISGNIYATSWGYMLTLLLGCLFTVIQLSEYIEVRFSIADSVYGSTFFMITGLHGAHVIVGTLFIFVGFYRTLAGHFTRSHHLGFEFAVWYWHFVDVVWLFVFTFIYFWGSR